MYWESEFEQIMASDYFNFQKESESAKIIWDAIKYELEFNMLKENINSKEDIVNQLLGVKNRLVKSVFSSEEVEELSFQIDHVIKNLK
ncbi:hypothetical protein SCHIN_v1c05710 [Spiroplasma chinense]|uniref:Uncharacterized protein n=1 Tax=Spiroplasma chinense TaxID=216932 RepID=A0A5B9Y3N3_9MOLU|nr:hypothetical protein [Spiroplasma chinense]QEH61768.1 hypothetical protein SCHIN_v1c05710 [Spiroplasma chinense]